MAFKQMAVKYGVLKKNEEQGAKSSLENVNQNISDL